jgi:Mitochondrial carrier protein
VAGTAAAGVAIALLSQSPAVLAQAADTLEEFAKHFVIGGFAAAVGYGSPHALCRAQEGRAGCSPLGALFKEEDRNARRQATQQLCTRVVHALTPQCACVCRTCIVTSRTAAVYPLDVLKTRMQVQPTRWTNALSCAREAMAQGGIPALYAGLGAQLVGVAPEKSVKVCCQCSRECVFPGALTHETCYSCLRLWLTMRATRLCSQL